MTSGSDLFGNIGGYTALRGAPSKGTVVGGRYELVREIARGGMGVVFEARQTYTGRSIALKLVADSTQVALSRRRLLQEALALGAVRHPGVVDVIDAGECPREGPFIAMEMLEGRTLDGILAARRRLSVAEALHVGRSVGEALAAAHRRGIVHRDVKPANIFIVRGHGGAETIKLIDFGIAGRVGDPSIDDTRTRITRAGDMLGTLDYVCPEQLVRAEVVDARSDQYALATVLFECLTGSLPPITARLAGPSRLLDLAAVAPGLGKSAITAILRGMMPEVAARLPDMDTFLLGLLDGAAPSATSILEKAGPPQESRPERKSISRRRYRRAPYVTPCRVVREDGTHIDARSEDISEGGLLLVLPHAFPQRDGASAETVRIRFALPTSGLVATVGATIRWIKDGRGRAALGVEFERVAPEVSASIATYVTHFGAADTLH